MKRTNKIFFKTIMFFSCVLISLSCFTAQNTFQIKSEKVFLETRRLANAIDIIFREESVKKSDWDKLKEFFSSYQLGETGRIQLIDIDANIIFNSESSKIFNLSDEQYEEILNIKEGILVIKNDNRSKKICAVFHLDRSAYIVLLLIDENDNWFNK